MSKILYTLLAALMLTSATYAYQVEVVPNGKKFKATELDSWGTDGDYYKFYQLKFKEGSLPTFNDLTARGIAKAQLQYHSMNVFIEGLQVPANCQNYGFNLGLKDSVTVHFPGNEQTREYCFKKMIDDILANDREIEVVHFYTRIIK
jgi:hypothetical protein